MVQLPEDTKEKSLILARAMGWNVIQVSARYGDHWTEIWPPGVVAEEGAITDLYHQDSLLWLFSVIRWTRDEDDRCMVSTFKDWWKKYSWRSLIQEDFQTAVLDQVCRIVLGIKLEEEILLSGFPSQHVEGRWFCKCDKHFVHMDLNKCNRCGTQRPLKVEPEPDLAMSDESEVEGTQTVPGPTLQAIEEALDGGSKVKKIALFVSYMVPGIRPGCSTMTIHGRDKLTRNCGTCAHEAGG